MAAISDIRRVAQETYKVAVDWSDGRQFYVVTVHDEGGIRGITAPDDKYPELKRCPFIAKYLLPLVFGLHDGKQISLPVEIPEEKLG